MKPERLQEIKDEVLDWFDTSEHVHDVVQELITAYEQAQAENRWTVKYREAIIEDKAMARKLAASQAEVERLRYGVIGAYLKREKEE